VVEIPVAMGALLVFLGFFKALTFEPEELIDGDEPLELFEVMDVVEDGAIVVAFNFRYESEFIKESGEMLLRVGDNSTGLKLFSGVNGLISLSESFPFKSSIDSLKP
jgi:hypothetical protein